MNKALFLDRDGVINIDHGYVHRIEDFHFVDGIFDLCRRAAAAEHYIIVVSNQSGIARGLFDEGDLGNLHQWMLGVFKKEKISILDVFYCPHHPKYSIADEERDCNCRKPKSGMLDMARAKHAIDMSGSTMIGDKLSDQQAAKSAGIGRFFLFAPKKTDLAKEKASGHQLVANFGDISFD